MYLIHKLFIGIVFVLPIIIHHYHKFMISDALASNIFTLVGILFGFTIAAATAMQGNGFIAKQAKNVDLSTKGIQKTNAQRLCEYVNFACMSDIILIIMLVVKSFIPQAAFAFDVIGIIAVALTGVVLVSSYFVLRIVMSFLRQS